MNIDDRLAAITMNLELLSRDREEDKGKIQALFLLAEQQLQAARELTKNSELQNQAIREQNQANREQNQVICEPNHGRDKDAHAIRALARIAENHERRLSTTEGFAAVEPNQPAP